VGVKQTKINTIVKDGIVSHLKTNWL